MSDATTALAEALRAHLCFADSLKKPPFPDRPFYSMCCGDDCAWESQFVATEREAEEQAASHQATFVVAAVRGLSPDLQAELIGGEVEAFVERDGNRIGPASMEDAQWLATGSRGWTIQARAVGPWTDQAEEAS